MLIFSLNDPLDLVCFKPSIIFILIEELL